MKARYSRAITVFFSAFLLALTVRPGHAQIDVSLPGLVGGVGASNQIAVTVGDLSGQGVDSVSFTLSYDASIIELTGIATGGTLAAGAATTVDTDTSGELGVTIKQNAPFAAGGTLVKLDAELLAEGSTDLAFDAFAFEDGSPAASTTNGSVTVTAAARIQFIAASSDAGLDSVDVYVNGVRLLNDASNPGASEYVIVPANAMLTLAVAAGDSDTANEAVATRSQTLGEGEAYVVVFTGLRGGGDNAPRLILQADAREVASDPGQVDVRAISGASGADSIHVGLGDGAAMVSAPRDTFTTYVSAAASGPAYVTLGSGSNTRIFVLNDLSMYQGEAITFAAYGSTEMPGGSNVVAVRADGRVVQATFSPTARVQFIHASADATADSVDIYVNGVRVLDDLVRYDATPFINVSADVELDVVVAAGNSDSAAEELAARRVTLDAENTYVGAISGVDGTSRPLQIRMRSDAQETATVGNRVQYAGFHGLVDSDGPLTVVVGPSGLLTESATYGRFSDYVSATKNALIDVRVGDGAGQRLFRFSNTEAYLGEALTIVAAGSSSDDLDVFAVRSDGETVQPSAFVSASARVQLIHNSDDPLLDSVDVYINDSLIVDNALFRSATPFVNVSAGVPLTVDVAPGNSDSSAEAEVSLDVVLAEGETYIGVIAGEANSDEPSAALNLFVKSDAREMAIDAESVEVLAFNGMEGERVDLSVRTSVSAPDPVSTLGSDLGFGDFTMYDALDPASYVLDVSTDAGLVEQFTFDVSGMAGAALTVLTSGEVSNGIDVWVVRADGTVMAAAVATSVAESVEVPDAFRIEGNYPNPFNPSTTIRFDLPSQADVRVEVYDMMGRRVMTTDAGTIAAGAGRTVSLDGISLASGNYVYRVIAESAAHRLVETGTMTFIK